MQLTSAIIILIIIVIIAIWFTHHLYKNGQLPQGAFHDTYKNFVDATNYKYDEYFTSPGELFKKTTGYELDDNAKLAINKSQKKDDMYTSNEFNGTMSRSKVGDAADNSFILANLLNYNAAPNEEDAPKKRNTRKRAAKYFAKTMNRITADPTAVLQTAPQPVEFMVNRAQDFYDDYLLQLHAEDPMLIQEIYVPNFNQIRDTVRNTRTNNIKTNVKQKKREKVFPADTPAKTIEQELYYNERTVPSDPQNVHDSQVINDTHGIYQRIREKNFQDEIVGDSGQSNGDKNDAIFKDIRRAIQKYPFTNEIQRANAKKVLDTMSVGSNIISLDTSERQLIVDVWKRINSPENHSKRGTLHESFMNSLSDGIENGKPVCTMGRCGRMLGSLTLLDADPEIAKPTKTKEILRNEIFSKSHAIIKKVLDDTPIHIAKAYQDPEIFAQADSKIKKKVDKLENKLKQEIETTLQQDYKDVKPATLDNLIKDAQAGV
jgi:hypothetical protein